MPEGRARTYGWLVFFFPSLLYWPSSIGKEAWICFGLGLASYGVALILRHQPDLVLCGHIHESPGQDRLGASRIRPSLRRTRPGTLIPMPTRG